MKFPRNARIFRGQLDAAPFITVFFLLVMFLLMGSLLYTPGVRIELPRADGLAGTDKLTVAVAIDANGRLYYENQWIEEEALRARLRNAARTYGEPVALVVQADKSVSHDRIVRLLEVAKDTGIAEVQLATLPRSIASPASR